MMNDAELAEIQFRYDRALTAGGIVAIHKLRTLRNAQHTWYGSEQNDLRIKIDKLLTARST